MLQDNVRSSGHGAHLAHAAVVGMHVLCCGLPILAMAAAGLSSFASTVVLFARSAQEIHHWVHSYEMWVLALSASLVVAGGALEAAARRRGGPAKAFPWLYALSVACFGFNVLLVMAHRA